MCQVGGNHAFPVFGILVRFQAGCQESHPLKTRIRSNERPESLIGQILPLAEHGIVHAIKMKL